MSIGRLMVVCALTFASATSAFAGGTVILVRHAERADPAPGDTAAAVTDPELSPGGRARAEALAYLLQDAGISAIFATQYKRTQQTAAPLANALGIPVQAVDGRDVEGLIAMINAASGNVLVVGHSNTVPGILRALGVETDVTIPETEFDNLFIVSRAAPEPVLTRLHYR